MTGSAFSRRSDNERAASFARDTEPLFDVLARRARRLARSQADAEDLLQDTLLHAYVSFHTFQEGTNLKAWLFRILYNRWVSAYRAGRSRTPEVPVDAVSEHELAASAARARLGCSAEAEVLDTWPDNEIKAAMENLSADFRTVVYLTQIEGYTYAETAAILGIPQGTVMSRAGRGRQRLRFALAHIA